MTKRLNIVLPKATARTIDRMVKPGERSPFIDQAMGHYVANRATGALKTRLERAVARDQDIDREVAADWFAADQQQWQQLDKPKRKPVTPSGTKSTA